MMSMMWLMWAMWLVPLLVLGLVLVPLALVAVRRGAHARGGWPMTQHAGRPPVGDGGGDEAPAADSNSGH